MLNGERGEILLMEKDIKMSQKKHKEEDLRIGVFICDCGSNIAGHLDCSSVTEYASTLPGVVYAKENLYTCSEAGIGEIQKGIKEQNLNRVVVASCSPRTHQPLFQNSCAAAELNPYLFEMVNIRDQCSWVHMQERDDATQKAKDLVRMGVSKAAFLEPQKDIEASLIPRVLVIGGGAAGLSAAGSLAEMGLDVVLVEKEAETGGLLRQINRLAPHGEKAMDRVREMTESVKARPNVTLYLGSRVEDVTGYIGNFEITIRPEGGDALKEKVGCIVVATGAVPLKPEGLYEYDGIRVITQMELEERLLSGALNARQVVMIQCVGARCPEREYCSRICCRTAVKNARLIKQEVPEAHVHILYRDMQMYGTENEQMLWDARGEGVRFDVFSPDQPPVVKEDRVQFYRPLTGETMEIPCDLVVLSTPLVPREGAQALSQLLRVPVDQNGFFLEAHAKLRPLDFATDGMFVLRVGPIPCHCGGGGVPGAGRLFADRHHFVQGQAHHQRHCGRDRSGELRGMHGMHGDVPL